jgi:hypothetical protein
VSRVGGYQSFGCWRAGVQSFVRIVAGLSALLVPSESAAYRTIESLPDFPDGQRIRWAAGGFQYQVRDSVPDSIPLGNLTSAAQREFEAWSQIGCASVSVVYGGATSDPARSGDGVNTIEVISIGWEDLGYEPEAVGATELEFELVGEMWVIVEADIRLNAEHHVWSRSDLPTVGGERSLLATLRHEGGHALGLLHPCELDGADEAPVCEGASVVSETIMYPLYEAAQFDLLEDDRAGICFLYPSCELEGCPADQSCTSQGCAPNCGDEPCALNELCIDQRCVPEAECELGGCEPASVSCDPTPQCPSGRCWPDGTCDFTCVQDADCPTERTCIFSADPDAPGRCSDPILREVGEPCSAPEECAGGECLVGAGNDPVCSQACGGVRPPCLKGWSCGNVDDRAVCIPPRSPRGCGVAVWRRADEHAAALFLTLALGLGVRLRARNRTRPSRRSSKTEVRRS